MRFRNNPNIWVEFAFEKNCRCNSHDNIRVFLNRLEPHLRYNTVTLLFYDPGNIRAWNKRKQYLIAKTENMNIIRLWYV